MFDQRWGAFATYVNAYYAVQEAYDSARRAWERPAPGLQEFCRDANPFLWDEESSAEPDIYEGFKAAFYERFPTRECAASEGRELVREWLSTLEGDAYGTSLVSSLEQVSGADDWREAYEPIAKQLAARAVRLERTPQDMPEPFQTPLEPVRPTQANIEAVIALLAKGDEAFAQSLRERLSQEDA
ncbi:MAG: hypothetical protein Q4A07_02625 [Coriobacteriales bacterium]|nr:hypothetical protein [Coriobacteriales bacterium]